MPASPPPTRWSTWPTRHSSLELAGHGQSSAPLGLTPLLLQPLTAPCFSPPTRISAPQSLGLLPTVPSYTSASTVSLGFRSLLAFIHLRDPSLCASVPCSLGASCLRVSVPQGPLCSGPPGCTVCAVPPQPLSGPPTSSGPARSSSISGGSLPVHLPTPFLVAHSLWGGAEDHRGAALPPRTDADPAAPWGGSGSTSLL